MSDWYGTSCLFASTFRSSSIATGRRREMDVVDGFRSGRVGCTALSQSKKSAVSCSAQKRRSSSSLEKVGMFFLPFGARLLIDPPFSPTHVSRRNDADQCSTQSKNDGESAPLLRPTQRRESGLAS